ncbi:MAG: F0F1 ATP synthase subunit delta [Arenicellales bacterium WSBS_2016_MAG_OTU3]
MAENASLSRPYARAIFELAQGSNEYASWSATLKVAAQVVADETMHALIENPKVNADQIARLLTSIMGDGASAEAVNMIKLMAQNERLVLLPDVLEQYEVMRAEAQSEIDAEMVSARNVTEAQQNKVIDALSQRLGRKVNLKISIDETLIGGAIIRAGDLVIDGSAKGRLDKMAVALSAQ